MEQKTYNSLMYDLNPETGKPKNFIFLEEDRPEKIYQDRVDNYGDIRDTWLRLESPLTEEQKLMLLERGFDLLGDLYLQIVQVRT